MYLDNTIVFPLNENEQLNFIIFAHKRCGNVVISGGIVRLWHASKLLLWFSYDIPKCH